MDRSLDSIGSCSLDVDADSSDISDTSGSLNFATPISVKDITREFTANIRERCTLRSPVQPHPQALRKITTTAYVNLDPGTGGVHMVLSPPATDVADESHPMLDDVEKKPSYLNLACCVNGYSNLTTYDSKIRQDINKSREVSPIRPSTSSLQYCKRNNSLAAPVLHSMPLTKQPGTATASKYTALIKQNNNNNGDSKNGHLDNGDHAYCNGSTSGKSTTSSFIQQRVERLYGPGALAQGFYSPKKHNSTLSPVPRNHHKQTSHQQELTVPQSTELSRKFKQVSPSKDYGEFCKKLQNNCTQTAMARENLQVEQPPISHKGDVDLPVFRHLSHEFRAQLPTVSPKRTMNRTSPAPEVLLPLSNGAQLNTRDVVDHEAVKQEQLHSEEYISATRYTEDTIKSTPSPAPIFTSESTVAAEKDGNYFLKILKDEQVRLLALAAVAEKYIDALSNNPDITEDTFGRLRSASGKARLLASQKMKQFEGLCHNNLNRSPEDTFPTTIDDLQGFWDMVYLQVTHVDSIFAEIERLKANDWKRIIEEPKLEGASIKTTKTTKTGNLKAKTPSASNAAGTAVSNSVAAMKREAQRKQLLEMKRQRREALAAAAKDKAACDGNGEGDATAPAALSAAIANADDELHAAIGDTVIVAVKNIS